MAAVVGYLPAWPAAYILLTGLSSPLPGVFGYSGHETSWPTKMAEIPTITRLTLPVCPQLVLRKVRPKRTAREGTLNYLTLKILLLQNILKVVLFRIKDNTKPAVTLSLMVLAIAPACHVLHFLLSGLLQTFLTSFLWVPTWLWFIVVYGGKWVSKRSWEEIFSRHL